MYKAWNEKKKEFEEYIYNELFTAFNNSDLDDFGYALEREVPKLRKVYENKPEGTKKSAEKDFLSNHKLKELFAQILQTDDKAKYIEKFLCKVSIVNEDLRYSVNFSETKQFQKSDERNEESGRSFSNTTLERNKKRKKPIEAKPISQHKQIGKPLHVAIKARAFLNVSALLDRDDIDVNAECKSTKHTPLVMLFTIASTENIETIKKLLEKLTIKGANINLGFFQTHPLSVLCKNENLKDKKHELIKFCMNQFDCDVDVLYNGKTRKDLIEVKIPEEDIRHVAAQVDYSLLKTFLTAGKEDEFISEFKKFFGPNRTLSEVIKLLESATLKGRHRSVESIFKHLRDDARYYSDVEGILEQIKLTKQLKNICKNGFCKVLELYLNNIKTRIENKDNPILLLCVKELFKSRAPERLKCFQLVIGDRRISAEKYDDQKQTALHFAVQHGMAEEVRCIMVKRSPYLGTLNKEYETPLHRMKLDELKVFLDSRVTVPKQNESEIHLNLDGLIPPRRTKSKEKWYKDSHKSETASDSKQEHQEDGENTKTKPGSDEMLEREILFDEKPEIDVFYYISESEKLRPLLRHPVISTCLHIKWLFLRWIVYLLIALNLMFTVSFSVYSQWKSTSMQIICAIFLIYYIAFSMLFLTFDENFVKLCKLIANVWNKLKDDSLENSQNHQARLDSSGDARNLEEGSASAPLILNFSTQSSSPESDTPKSAQCDWKPLRFPDWMNPFYLLRLLISPAIIFLAILSIAYQNKTALSGVILLSGIDNIIHFKLLPSTSLSASIIMLETVSRSLLKSLSSYLILLLSFGLSFHVLLSNEGSGSEDSNECEKQFDSFCSMKGSMVKTLVMMIGEFNAQDIPFSDRQLSYLMFLFFVFLVTMVIMNLINGLAVSDVTELRQNAELDKLASWIKMLYRFENAYSAESVFRSFPSIRRYSSFYSRFEPKVIIKTDKDNMIQLIKIEEAKPIEDVCVTMPSNGQESSSSKHSKSKTKNQKKPVVGTTTCLQIFPLLMFCHSLNPNVCYTLSELAAENSLKEDVLESRWDKSVKNPKTKTRQMIARKNWNFALCKVLSEIRKPKNGSQKQEQKVVRGITGDKH